MNRGAWFHMLIMLAMLLSFTACARPTPALIGATATPPPSVTPTLAPSINPSPLPTPQPSPAATGVKQTLAPPTPTIAITRELPRPPATARIVFWATGWSVPGASQEIFVMNTDGTGVTAVSNARGDDMYPSWSPDGRRIAFVSKRDGNYEIYVMNADGSGQIRLTDSPEGEFHPRWSPDGTRIIFTRMMKPGIHDIFVMNADGSEITNLTNTPDIHEATPDFSPDGQQIVFISGSGGRPHGIYVMNADGTDVRLIQAGPLHFPRWSPDGQYIAFDGEPGGCKFEIYIMNMKKKADDTEIRQLTEHPKGCGGYNKAPAWSPDGTRLVYYSTDRFGTGGFDIFVINVDGTGETALTHGVTDLNAGGRDPDWSRAP